MISNLHQAASHEKNCNSAAR